MSKNVPYNAPDGAVGYITDVTQEHFYNEPDIGLYDELEQSCYELVCDFADLIGVHLDKNEQDCRLANMVRDFVVEMLEKEFQIPFPSYGESMEEAAARIKSAIEAFENIKKGLEPSKTIEAAQQSLVFNDNEECALALFEYLKKTGHIEGTEYDRESILHDINNLRGGEWLEILDRNINTKPFFDYIGGAEFLGDEFVYGSAVAPNILLKIVLNEDFPENITFKQVRDVLDNKGLQDLWDFSVEDLDEALENLSEDMMLIGVSFYEDDTYFARIFEITQEMADRFDDLLVMTERGDCVLPSDVRSGDVITGAYKKPLDAQIAASDVLKTKNTVPNGFPSLEQIKSDYAEIVNLTKDIRTVEAVKEFCKKYPIFVEINGVSVSEFEKHGGTNQDIEWIRYEAYGCLSYVYDRFDGNPMFDVWCDKGQCEFITDIRIGDLTKENYSKWVKEEVERNGGVCVGNER